jgi:hypothetical protein
MEFWYIKGATEEMGLSVRRVSSIHEFRGQAPNVRGHKGRLSPPKMRFLEPGIFLVSDITSFWPNPPLKLNVTKTSYAQASRYCPLDDYHVSIFSEGEAVKPLRNFLGLYSQNS